jgi:hypothetical protein
LSDSGRDGNSYIRAGFLKRRNNAVQACRLIVLDFIPPPPERVSDCEAGPSHELQKRVDLCPAIGLGNGRVHRVYW